MAPLRCSNLRPSQWDSGMEGAFEPLALLKVLSE